MVNYLLLEAVSYDEDEVYNALFVMTLNKEK